MKKSFSALLTLVILTAFNTAYAANSLDLKVSGIVGGLQLSGDGSKVLYVTQDSVSAQISATVLNISDASTFFSISGITGPVVMSADARFIAYRDLTTDLVTIHDTSSHSTSVIPNSHSDNSLIIPNTSSGPMITEDGQYVFYIAADVSAPNGRSLVKLKISDATTSAVFSPSTTWVNTEINRTGDTLFTSDFTGGNTSCLLGSIESCTTLTSGLAPKNQFCSRPPKSSCFSSDSWIVGGSSLGNSSVYSLSITKVKETYKTNKGKKRTRIIGYKMKASPPSSMKPFYIPLKSLVELAPYGTGVTGPGLSSTAQFGAMLTNLKTLNIHKRKIKDLQISKKNYIHVINLSTGKVLKSVATHSSKFDSHNYSAPVFSLLLSGKTTLNDPVLSADGSTVAYLLSQSDGIHVVVIPVF